MFINGMIGVNLSEVTRIDASNFCSANNYLENTLKRRI